jgi:hypothetical protein
MPPAPVGPPAAGCARARGGARSPGLAPLGPGAEPLDRLVEFGRARIRFLLENRKIARAALDGRTPVPLGPPAAMTQMHIRVLLRQMLYLPLDGTGPPEESIEDRLSRGWEDLIRRVCR